MARNAVSQTRDLKTPAVSGVYYRLSCLTGTNKGLGYYLKGPRVVLGRGENADIQVLDTKASREHLELIKLKQDYILTDLGSQNGVIVNELKVTQHKLSDNDRIVIGQTIYKYQVFNIEAQLAPVKKEKDSEVEEAPVSEENVFPEEKKKGSKKIFLIVGVLLLGYLFLSDDSSDAKKNIKTAKVDQTPTPPPYRAGASEDDKEMQEKITALIQQGQRELREGNFFRAINAFQVATNLDPQNGYAQFYLGKSRQSLDDEVKMNFFRAAQDVEALKYRAAIVSYCAVVRLLQAYPEDQRYKEALINIETIEQRIGLDKGETKCFEGQ